jgi:hypothetical protein
MGSFRSERRRFRTNAWRKPGGALEKYLTRPDFFIVFQPAGRRNTRR